MLQYQKGVDDGGGSLDYEWRDREAVFAEVRPLSSGGERFYGQQLEETLTHMITMRWRDNIDHKLRIVYDKRYFKIVRVVDKDERRRYLQILCEEGVAT